MKGERMLGPGSKYFAEKYNYYIGHTYKSLPVVPESASGVFMYDYDNDKYYVDFWASYSAVNIGHSNSRILRVAADAMSRGMVTRAVYVKDLADLAEKIVSLVGFDAMVIPKNTGVEAVETAIKTARMWAYRTGLRPRDSGKIITAKRNFHGRTITAVSFSSEKQYYEDFGPHTPGFDMVDYGNIEALKYVISPSTIAILLEPIQGEGGIILPPENYLQEVRKICDEKNILLILDEIQTGLGRTGKMFCYEYSGIKPDILLLGKALGGGVYPVSLAIGRRDIMKLWKPGDDGSTFGGNSIASSIALEALNIIIEEDLPGRSMDLGKYFLDELRKIKNPYIKEVRGKGLFIGIEFHPEAGGARQYCEKLIEEAETDVGIICKEAHTDVLRLSPPLIVEKKHLDFFIEKFQKVLED
jgi:ornithine--oxo-acid transaminase